MDDTSVSISGIRQLFEEKSLYFNHKESSGVVVDVVDLSYNVEIKGNTKYLLENINLSFQPGDMVALIGPSGAGKSTLLDMLADRKLYGNYSGDIYINKRLRSDTFNQETGYVLQDDLHIPILTVEETLYYAGWSRMPENTSHQDIQNRVNLLLEMMGLDPVRSSVIGNSMYKGISGGQLKRLSIGVEIISLPNLIFLDEPTSGLDSAISFEVMSAVMKLSQQNRTIVSTIHQPSPETFSLFNKVVLVVAGKLVYFGKTDQVISYFTNKILGYYYDGKKNPAEFIIDICGGKINPLDDDQPITPIQLANYFKESCSYCHVYKPIDSNFDCNNTLKNTKYLPSSQFTQFKMLVHRGWTVQMKDTSSLIALALRNLFGGLIIGIIFFGQGSATEPLFVNGQISSSTNSVTSVLYLSLSSVAFGQNAAIPFLCDQIIIIQRELKAGAYKPTPNWLAIILVPIIPMFLTSWLFGIPIYFLTGLTNNVEQFFYFIFLLIFLAEASYYLAMLVAAITKSATLSLMIFPFLLFFCNIFNGYIINLNTIPTFWTFAPYVSMNRWVLEGLMVNYFEDYSTDDNLDYSSGQGNVLAYYSFGSFNKNWCFLILLTYIVFNMLMSRLFLVAEKKRMVKVENASISNFESANVDPTSININISESSNLEKGFVHIPVDDTENENNSSKKGKRSGKILQRRKSLGQRAMSRSASISLTPSSRTLEKFRSRRRPVLGLRSASMYAPPSMLINTRNSLIIKTNINYDEDYPDYDSDNWIQEKSLTLEHFRSVSLSIKKDLTNCCHLLFQDLKYSVPNTKNKNSLISLLNGVAGLIKPGAGKSTLLDVLAGRKNTGTIEGKILFNGQTRSPEVMKSMAYVMQDNVHIPILTVKESLYYAAELRISELETKEMKAERVSSVIIMLGLEKVADTIVGDENMRGLSGGQVKRLSIGVEIVHFPNLIFLDEPTTGLDSAVSFEVMSSVRNLADQKRTILCTIHSPSAETGSLFDKLLLMAKGRVIYFGKTKNVIEYFVKSPYQFFYKNGSNPFDFVIAVAGSFVESHDQKKINGDELANFYTNHSNSKQLDDLIIKYMTENSTDLKQNKTVMVKVALNTSILHQMKTLVKRSFHVTLKDTRSLFAEFFRFSLYALLFAIIFVNQGSGTSDSVYKNRLSVFFFTLQDNLYAHQDIIPNFIKGRLLYYREKGSGAYCVFPYWLSIWIATIPILCLQVLIYCCIVYWAVGFRNEGKAFAVFYFFELLCSLNSFFLNLFLAAISPSVALSLMISTTFFILVLLFTGYLVFVNQFPNWLAWGTYISFMRWGYQGLVINEFSNNIDLPLGQYYIDTMGFNSYTIPQIAGILVAYVIGTAFFSYIGLIFSNFEKR